MKIITTIIFIGIPLVFVVLPALFVTVTFLLGCVGL